MKFKDRFEDEVCTTCDMYKNCDCNIDHQTQCATIALFFELRTIRKHIEHMED